MKKVTPLAFLLLFACITACEEGKIFLDEESTGDVFFDGLPAEPNANLQEFKVRSRWQKSELTYFIKSFSADVPQQQQRTIMAEAFGKWANVTNLAFSEVGSESQADIIIGFGSGHHCDLYQNTEIQCSGETAFDGPGNTLAHCYFPGQGKISGDAHFDDAETYAVQPTYSSVSLLSVAIHEIGHGLGLEHSTVGEAIMYPSYSSGNVKLDLAADDIQGIQSIYGVKGSAPPQPDPPDDNPPDPGATACGSPTPSDSDGDGIDNTTEYFIIGTNPNDCDTDNDGLPDNEVFYNLNPLNPDTDGDGVGDKTEIDQGSNPWIPDQGNPGGSYAGTYQGADSFGSPLGVTVYSNGAAEGLLAVLYFGFVQYIPLVGGLNTSGGLILTSYDYFFAYYGTFGQGSIQGTFQTAGGASGTWSVVKSGRAAPGDHTEDDLVSSALYHPAGSTITRPLPVHYKVKWK